MTFVSNDESKPQRLQASCGCDLPRRGFLSGLAALGGSTLLSACAPMGQTQAVRDRIDTHHHLFSPAYVKELQVLKMAPPLVAGWSLAKTMDDMDKAGVATSILSVTTPQVSVFKIDQARKVARESNEWVASMARLHPGRFGSFAMLPMQDADSALREMEYALDVLKADGIGLLTSYGDKWLGHPSFAPVMDELNRRKAILYTHPTAANCCENLLPNVPTTVVEFGTDTTRTIVDLVFSGTAARCPNVKFIFSHAGGTLPFLTERLQKMPVINKALAAKVPNGVMHELQRFYYDTAWSANPMALSSLLKLVSSSQVLFGSDYPYRTGEDNIKGLIDYGFSTADLKAIGRENAQRLIPRLKA
ncbi:MAG: amidohydrolase family protein [Burkholderiaceae bacterium]